MPVSGTSTPITKENVEAAQEELERLRFECIQKGAFVVSSSDVEAAHIDVATRRSRLVSDTRHEHRIFRDLLFLRGVLGAHWLAGLSQLPEWVVSLLASVLVFACVLLLLVSIHSTAAAGLICAGVSLAVVLVGMMSFFVALPREWAVEKWQHLRSHERDLHAWMEESRGRLHEAEMRLAHYQSCIDLRRHFTWHEERTNELVKALSDRRKQLLWTSWRTLRGIPFEDFLAEVFAVLGFSVETTKTSGDQGIDLIATRGVERLAIQAKGYGGTVGNAAVQEAYAGMAYYRCTRCVVVTNSEFTRSAMELSASTQCVLIDGTRLPDLINGKVF